MPGDRQRVGQRNPGKGIVRLHVPLNVIGPKRGLRPSVALPPTYPSLDQLGRERRAFLAGIVAAVAGALAEQIAAASSTIPGQKKDEKKKARTIPPQGAHKKKRKKSPPPADPGYAALPEAALDE